RAHLYGYAYYGEETQRVPLDERNRDVAALPFVIGVAGSRNDFDTHYAERGNVNRDVTVELVTPAFFSVLQVQPLHGRLLGPTDMDAPGSPIVVSDRVWEALFADKEWFANASITVDGEPHTIIGVVADLGRTGVYQLAPSDALFGVERNVFRVRP